MEVFVRKNGVFGGVCGGIADKLKVNVVLVRVLMLISAVCSFGLTFILYLAAVLSFPNVITLQFGDRPIFLGVCHNLAKKLKLHESWVRFMVLVLWIFTAFFPVFIIYMILFLLTGGLNDSKPINTPGSDGRVRDVN